MYITTGNWVWQLIGSIIVIIDASYILQRPDTLPGGTLAHYYQPYTLYTPHDPLYGDSEDHFAVVTSYLNLAQAAVTFLGLALTLASSKSLKLKGALLVLLSSAFVFWKTVLYLCYAWKFASQSVRGFQVSGVAFFWIPNLFWIVCPLWAVLSIGGRIGRELFVSIDSRPKRK